MPQPKVPPSERINSSFKKITSVAPELHAAAKELSNTIDELNSALEPLWLRVPAWCAISQHEDEHGNYRSRSIGYAYVDHGWKIALKTQSGNEQADVHQEEIWAFSAAPRWLILESIAKLPDLFETLAARVVDTTQKLKARNQQAKELVAAVRAAVDELKVSALDF